MTFGASFGRTFSPTFQPSSQAAASSWWLAGGWWAVDPETGTLINLSKYENKVYRIVGYRRLQ